MIEDQLVCKPSIILIVGAEVVSQAQNLMARPALDKARIAASDRPLALRGWMRNGTTFAEEARTHYLWSHRDCRGLWRPGHHRAINFDHAKPRARTVAARPQSHIGRWSTHQDGGGDDWERCLQWMYMSLLWRERTQTALAPRSRADTRVGTWGAIGPRLCAAKLAPVWRLTEPSAIDESRKLGAESLLCGFGTGETWAPFGPEKDYVRLTHAHRWTSRRTTANRSKECVRTV